MGFEAGHLTGELPRNPAERLVNAGKEVIALGMRMHFDIVGPYMDIDPQMALLGGEGELDAEFLHIEFPQFR